MVGLIILLALTLFAVLSAIFGVDSREESTDPRGPFHPVGLS
jgi:hypothetical protein